MLHPGSEVIEPVGEGQWLYSGFLVTPEETQPTLRLSDKNPAEWSKFPNLWKATGPSGRPASCGPDLLLVCSQVKAIPQFVDDAKQHTG
jgi:hypothetical protein